MGKQPKTNALEAMRFLNRTQLNAVIRRNEWCNNVEAFGIDNEEIREKVRNRAESKLIENPERDWGEFLKYLRNDLFEGGYRKTSERIENCLRETKVRPLNKIEESDEQENGKNRKEELWYSAQFYGALDREFHSPSELFRGQRPVQHLVAREHDKWGLFVDIFIRNKRTGKEYLIEVKRAGVHNYLTEIEGQLKRYNAIFDDRDRIYLVLLYNHLQDFASLAPGVETRRDIENYVCENIDLNKIDTLLVEIDPGP